MLKELVEEYFAQHDAEPEMIDIFFLMLRQPPSSTLFSYTTLFRSNTMLRYVPGQKTPEFKTVFRFRSEEHTSELQSHSDLVCRLLLEKKNSCSNARAESPTRSRRVSRSSLGPRRAATPSTQNGQNG